MKKYSSIYLPIRVSFPFEKDDRMYEITGILYHYSPRKLSLKIECTPNNPAQYHGKIYNNFRELGIEFGKKKKWTLSDLMYLNIRGEPIENLQHFKNNLNSASNSKAPTGSQGYENIQSLLDKADHLTKMSQIGHDEENAQIGHDEENSHTSPEISPTPSSVTQSGRSSTKRKSSSTTLKISKPVTRRSKNKNKLPTPASPDSMVIDLDDIPSRISDLDMQMISTSSPVQRPEKKRQIQNSSLDTSLWNSSKLKNFKVQPCDPMDEKDLTTNPFNENQWIYRDQIKSKEFNRVASLFTLFLFIKREYPWPMELSRVTNLYSEPPLKFNLVMESVFEKYDISRYYYDIKDNFVLLMVVWSIVSLNEYGEVRPILFNTSEREQQKGRLLHSLFCRAQHDKSILYTMTWPFRPTNYAIQYHYNHTKVKEISINDMMQIMRVDARKVFKNIPRWVYKLCIE